jgi:hypothetical protein
MFKKSLVALGTVAVLAIGALPAFANTDSVFGNNDYTQIDNAKAAVQQQLLQKGVKATGVDEWSGYVRADVQLADGTTAVRFFDAGSLAPVDINHLN